MRAGRSRRCRDERLPRLRPRLAALVGVEVDELVAAEGLAVEEHAEPQALEHRRIVALFAELHRIDAERCEQPARDRAVGIGAVDVERAAVDQLHAAVHVELVALGVAAEIVVVLDDQDLRTGPRGAIEIRRRQPADAAAHDDEVVALVRVDQRCRLGPEIAVAHFMRRLERAGMAAAHAKPRRRIIVRRVLRLAFAARPRR